MVRLHLGEQRSGCLPWSEPTVPVPIERARRCRVLGLPAELSVWPLRRQRGRVLESLGRHRSFQVSFSEGARR